MKTLISSKGQIVLPVELRRQDAVEPGQQFAIERLERGKYILERVTSKPNEGLVALLAACPVKDVLAPPLRAESTDAVDLPRLG